VGLTDGGGALSADGVIIAIRAISSELPIRNRPIPFIIFIIFPPLCQRIFRAESFQAASRCDRTNSAVADRAERVLAEDPVSNEDDVTSG
jgi:hypothetical protein